MELKLPTLGEGVDSGTVVSLLVKEGDAISKGQGILELETGKAIAPVPSPAAGKVLKILVSVGDTVSVGQPLLSLTETGAKASHEPEKKEKPARAAAAPKLAPGAPPSWRLTAPHTPDELPEENELEEEPPENALPPAASPAIRHLARELGIDLRKLHGTSRGGRIVMEDLRAYIERLHRQLARAKAAAARTTLPIKPPAEKIDFTRWGPITRRPMTQLREVISQRMSESWNAVARVTQFNEADIGPLMDLRKKFAPIYEQKGAHLTLTSFALKIVVDALKKFPIFNASLDEGAGEIVFKEYHHIGIAVDTEQGLIVPVLRDVDKKDLVVLSKELSDFAVKARERKIALEDLQGGTFTITNQGGIGGTGHFTPMVNIPELAVLGIGKGEVKAVVRDGKIEPRLMLPLSLSYDHRAIDGGTAVRFMLELVHGFEKFDEQNLK